jgi:phosphate transport system substrate-binding protein
VNAKNSVGNLTKAQVEGIFTGTITNWHDVGGPDAAIHLVARDPISGTYIGFKDLAMGSKSYAVDNITFGESYSAVAEKVGMDEAAIGYTGIQGNPASVKSVNIEGVEATAANVNSGKYPYARGLYFYTLKGEEKPAAKSFVDFVNGTKGQAILSQMGFVPHP